MLYDYQESFQQKITAHSCRLFMITWISFWLDKMWLLDNLIWQSFTHLLYTVENWWFTYTYTLLNVYIILNTVYYLYLASLSWLTLILTDKANMMSSINVNLVFLFGLNHIYKVVLRNAFCICSVCLYLNLLLEDMYLHWFGGI